MNTSDLISYYADRYVMYMVEGNNRMAIKMGKKLTELIAKNEIKLYQQKLFKNEDL